MSQNETTINKNDSEEVVVDDKTNNDDVEEQENEMEEDDESNDYCQIVRDSSWRGSTFHFVFYNGSAYLDIIVADPTTGAGAKTSFHSFDGAGCYRGLAEPFPQALAASLLQLVPEEKSRAIIFKGDQLASEIEEFYISVFDKIENIWRSDFIENEVILNVDRVSHLLPSKKE